MRGSQNILTEETDAEFRAQMVCDLNADTIAVYETMSDWEPSPTPYVPLHEEVGHAAA